MFSNDISRQRPQNRSCVGPESVQGSRDSPVLSRDCPRPSLPARAHPGRDVGCRGKPWPLHLENASITGSLGTLSTGLNGVIQIKWLTTLMMGKVFVAQSCLTLSNPHRL